MRECGLKSGYPGRPPGSKNVTPFAGVWIEIFTTQWKNAADSVTPFAGVWIEISLNYRARFGTGSLPLRECGLKLNDLILLVLLFTVTPFAGVWIEIKLKGLFQIMGKKSLPLRECGLK